MVVKLFLRHSLHAKLYLLFRADPINPITGYLGSSNLNTGRAFPSGRVERGCSGSRRCQQAGRMV